jgi:uncharacterized membrane protein YdjX (TVP38/TMEM64 family)
MMSKDHDPSLPIAGEAPKFSARRLAPLVAVVLLMGIVFAMGWHRELSLEALVRHRAAIDTLISEHRLFAIAAYIGLYIAVVALSLPGGLVLTLSGGFLFGGMVGGSAAIVGATIGAVCIFLIARSAIGDFLTRRAGPLAARLAEGFRTDAFNYLLFLRLVPVFPFFLVNLVPALAGVRLATFTAATAIGIVPAAFAIAFVGAGLDSVIAAQEAAYNGCVAAGRPGCRLQFDISAALTPQLFAGLAALGVFALVPVVVKRLRARSRAESPSR